MPNVNVYTDVMTFKARTFGIPTPGLIGVNTRLQSGIAAGVSSLPVVSSAKITQAGDNIYILDGPNTEVIPSSLTTPAPDANHIALSAPTAFTHAAGINVSSPGSKTPQALAELLIRASGMMEDYCRQGNLTDHGLFQKSRALNIELDTPWALVDVDYNVVFRPLWIPVTSIASASVLSSDGNITPLDITNAVYDAGQQRVTFPRSQASSGTQFIPGSNLEGFYLERGMKGWLQVTFTSGVTASAVPNSLVEACTLFTMELLGFAQNPAGAAEVRRGDAQTMFRQRGDVKNSDGIYANNARALLDEWRLNY